MDSDTAAQPNLDQVPGTHQGRGMEDVVPPQVVQHVNTLNDLDNIKAWELPDYASPELLEKVEEIQYRLQNDDCFLGQVTGQAKGVRTGKSNTMQYLSLLIDPTFSAKRVVFTPFGWNRKQQELDPGEALVKDEPRGSQRRQWGGVENMDQLETLTEWGYKNLAGWNAHPHAGMIDRAQLMLSDAWVEMEDYMHPAPGYEVPPEGYRAAVWHDVSTKTVRSEGGPRTLVFTHPRFRFFVPNMALLMPSLVAEYKERAAYYKRTGDEPDYARNIDDEAYKQMRQTYLKRKKLDRMGRAMRQRV